MDPVVDLDALSREQDGRPLGLGLGEAALECAEGLCPFAEVGGVEDLAVILVEQKGLQHHLTLEQAFDPVLAAFIGHRHHRSPRISQRRIHHHHTEGHRVGRNRALARQQPQCAADIAEHVLDIFVVLGAQLRRLRSEDLGVCKRRGQHLLQKRTLALHIVVDDPVRRVERRVEH